MNNHSNWEGKIIWECATTPSTTKEDGYISQKTVMRKIRKFEQKCDNFGYPSHFILVFPINSIDYQVKQILDNFKCQYKGAVEIKYYDCHQTQNFISQISKLNNLTQIDDLVLYIQNIRSTFLGREL
ncbi:MULTISPECIES: hypothetical protein [Aphanizomenon]|uniref:hypothetical protein n=1 Tax=Aphanizomenon TaxID=1175 RepID=UPI00054379DC|nr:MULTISPECIES: hypothetical protein [Aphanizomenon]KHG39420.1 hypothetical protein OA07_23790 [Aphanizomenon flos-aquae 2012/KM1/D3]MTJ32014.1 hypothetical protein [Aphanizomenon sp. UHCC 0183]QSV69915.1 MAG: hypothetical protein HEQ20_03075 [Aphanizomenon flos-aquae KM1D3_PB]